MSARPLLEPNYIQANRQVVTDQRFYMASSLSHFNQMIQRAVVDCRLDAKLDVHFPHAARARNETLAARLDDYLASGRRRNRAPQNVRLSVFRSSAQDPR
jgi:hypothetical protein